MIVTVMMMIKNDNITSADNNGNGDNTVIGNNNAFGEGLTYKYLNT